MSASDPYLLVRASCGCHIQSNDGGTTWTLADRCARHVMFAVVAERVPLETLSGSEWAQREGLALHRPLL